MQVMDEEDKTKSSIWFFIGCSSWAPPPWVEEQNKSNTKKTNHPIDTI